MPGSSYYLVSLAMFESKRTFYNFNGKTHSVGKVNIQFYKTTVSLS